MAVSGAKSRLLLIAYTYPDPVVGILEIQLGVHLGTRETVQDLSDEGEGSTVLDRTRVQRTVVDNKA